MLNQISNEKSNHKWEIESQMTFPNSISNFDFRIRFPNSISKCRFHNFDFQISISQLRFPNLDFDATFVECIWHLRRIPIRISTRQIRPRSTLVANYKVCKIREDTFGILGILSGFGGILSGFWRFSMILFMFEYTLDIIFDRSIIKWHQLTDIKQ